MTEEWRDTPGLEGHYQVSSLGNVRSVHRRRPLRPFVTKEGYRRLTIRLNGLQGYRYVHRLVAAAFLGPCPEGYEVDHIDTCRTHNVVDNLRYVTTRENVLRGIGMTAENARKTHCHQGHPFDAANTFVKLLRSGGFGRSCRTCERLRMRRVRRLRRLA